MILVDFLIFRFTLTFGCWLYPCLKIFPFVHSCYADWVMLGSLSARKAKNLSYHLKVFKEEWGRTTACSYWMFFTFYSYLKHRIRSRALPQVCYEVDFVSDCRQDKLNSYRVVTLKNNDGNNVGRGLFRPLLCMGKWVLKGEILPSLVNLRLPWRGRWSLLLLPFGSKRSLCLALQIVTAYISLTGYTLLPVSDLHRVSVGGRRVSAKTTWERGKALCVAGCGEGRDVMSAWLQIQK